MELLISVTIIAILATIAKVGYEVMVEKAHFSKIEADMKTITETAYSDYTNTGNWAPIELPGDLPPSFATNGLPAWPLPPCPGWSYSWDNFSGFPADSIRITLRRPDMTPLWSSCLQSYGTTCLSLDFYTGLNTIEMSTLDTTHFNCNQ